MRLPQQWMPWLLPALPKVPVSAHYVHVQCPMVDVAPPCRSNKCGVVCRCGRLWDYVREANDHDQ